jgi:glycerol-3-phosphate dehydrogenase
MDQPPSLSHPSRSDHLGRLEAEHFDVLIIGGGITGAGIARDAAARGLRVALAEADDFAAGTSSRSSKLIHGGLRYLAMGEVGMVRETALERKAVHAMAPHLAEPCWMLVPARNRASVLKFRTGIGTYEKLGAVDDIDRHIVWDAEELADNEPLLRNDEYHYGVAYREYLTDDARLVVGVLRSAVANDAVVANFLPVTGLVRQGERIEGAVCRCAISDAEVTIRAACVVNAAGPWVEQLASMEEDPPQTRLHLSKGVHAVVPLERLPVQNLVILGTSDKRSIFAIPRGDTVTIGTTDTSYVGSRPLWPEITAEDIQYLLDPLPRYFDVEPLSLTDVTAAWSGVRPLVAQANKEPKEMSRKDEIWTGSGGMINIAGGKLTGFRLMAENIMKEVADHLGHKLTEGPGNEPIPGGHLGRDLSAAAAKVASDTGITPAMAERLVRLYGSETAAIVSRGSDPVVEGGLVVTGEIDWAVGVEAAQRLEDVIFRRTRAAWYLPDERDRLVPAVASRMAQSLGWNEKRIETEVAAVQVLLADELSFKTGAPA